MIYRNRANSRTVTQNLLDLSQEGINHSNTIDVSEQYRKQKVHDIKTLQKIKDNQNYRATSLSLKTYSSLQKRRSIQLKNRFNPEQFLKSKQIPVTKVSLKFNKINMAIRDISQTHNKLCFISKKLKPSLTLNMSQKKRSFSKRVSKYQKVSQTPQSQTRIYATPHGENQTKLKNINEIRKKYTFFKKLNNLLN